MTSTSSIRHRRLNALQVMLQLWNRWVILPRLAHYLQTARHRYWQHRQCLVTRIKLSDLFGFLTRAWSNLFLFGTIPIVNYFADLFVTVLSLMSLITSVRGGIFIFFVYIRFYCCILLFYFLTFNMYKEGLWTYKILMLRFQRKYLFTAPKKWFRKISVCMWLALSVPKPSTKAAGPFFSKHSENLFFRPNWMHEKLFWKIQKSTPILTNISTFYQKLYCLFL